MSLRLLLLTLLALCLGCARAQVPPASSTAAAEAGTGTASPAAAAPSKPTGARPGGQYAIGPGDTLQVQVYGEPTLTGPFPVNDAGMLDFPLLGAVSVAGLTAPQAGERLRALLADGYINEPNVTAWLESYRSQPVQVLGAVKEPGVYYLRGDTTVLEILSEAGGVSAEGVAEVRVTHGGEDGEVTRIPFDTLLRRGEGNLALQGGDIVFVPESVVTVMGSVGKPGVVALREDLTLTRAIAAAGGALDTANLGRVTIMRGEQRIVVNVRRIMKGQAEDLPVEPGDRIFVGESVL